MPVSDLHRQIADRIPRRHEYSRSAVVQNTHCVDNPVCSLGRPLLGSRPEVQRWSPGPQS